MLPFTYSVTDLTDYESAAFEIFLDREDAIAFGARMARELLEAVPDLSRKGMCIAVYDPQDRAVSVVPLDPVSSPLFFRESFESKIALPGEAKAIREARSVRS